MRLGILTSHPIQYQAPWFRALAGRCELEVFFAHRQSAAEQGQAGFGVAFDWDVDLLSGYPHRFLQNVSAAPGVNHFGGCDTPELTGLIARGKFDAFIVTGWYLKSYRQAMAACRAAGVPVLVRGDSQLGTPRPWFKRLAMEYTQRALLRQFDGFLTVGERNREYLEHFGASPEKIFSVPHLVDNDWFAKRAEAAAAQRTELRKSWGAGEKDLVALFAGKFQPVKRPLDLLRAVTLTGKASKSAAWQAVLLGSGELESELRAEAARSGARVHFAGFKNQSELPACYAAADVLVVPSATETWGLVVNEAMTCGCPAIVSDTCGCAPDLIDPGVTGFTFPAGDVAALAGRLTELAALKSSGHDFRPALAAKLANYSVASAVQGTLAAVAKIRRAQ